MQGRERVKVDTARILLVLLSCAIIAVAATAVVSWTFQIKGTVIAPKTSNLTVYDSDGTTVLREIDWGEMEQGKTYTHTIWVKNTGTTSLKLHLNRPSSAWTEGSWGTFFWDLEGYVLPPGESVKGTLTWAISSIAPLGPTGTIYIGIEGTET